MIWCIGTGGADEGYIDPRATCSYIFGMVTVTMRDAKNHLTKLARQVESGETVVVTRNGKPVFEMVQPRPRTGLNFEALAEYKRKHGIDKIIAYIPDDFDDALPEDFLIQPLPLGE